MAEHRVSRRSSPSIYKMHIIVKQMREGRLQPQYVNKGYGKGHGRTFRRCERCLSDLYRFPVYFGNICMECMDLKKHTVKRGTDD